MESAQSLWIQPKLETSAPAAPQESESEKTPPSQAPRSRPANLARSLFHLGAALLALALVIFIPSRTWLLILCSCFFVYAWSMELGRRLWPGLNERLMRLYGRIAHAHEHREVNSATWYVTALMLLAVFASKPAMASAVMVLGVADPAAGWIGRRYGKRKLLAGRSLEGSLTFTLVGFAISLPFLLLFSTWSLGTALVVAGLCGLSGALAELFTLRFDDNFTIPAVVGGIVTAAGLLV